MGKEKNPINEDEKKRQAQEPERIVPDLESDKFSQEEQKKIIEMVLDDADEGVASMAEWKQKKEKDLQHINSEKPSVIEGLKKDAWMSDRNLGLTAGICDIYQATLLATCYNPDTIHFKSTQENDINNKDNVEKFSKWALGENEADFFPEVDDYINNKVSLGFSVFKIIWEVTYEWVDKRIPKFSEDNKKRIVGYDIKTEKVRRERGFIKNVDELDDILIPTYGKKIQDLSFLIEILHPRYTQLEDLAERGVIVNFEENKNKFLGIQSEQTQKLRTNDETNLGTTTNTIQGQESEKRNKPIDIYEWYGWYSKNGKYERYRFWVEPVNKIFLAGKPLRKITRAGKIPYVGGPLRRRPGFLRGGSLTTLIAPAINALNNNYNQTSDFQYFENIPFGFYDENQESLKGVIQEISPGKMTGVDGDPNKKIYFPNLSRSLAWSSEDKQFLMEVIERLTGAASYFLATAPNSTATRDNIVEQKGEVKFGLWVKRIQEEISEAVNMFIQMYQDFADPTLAKRVIGEDGKHIIKNLSINSLRGMYSAYLVPDITSGSKAYERQISIWASQAMQQECIWMSPQVNPRGNWLLWKFVMQKQGIENPEYYLPPQPKEQGDYNKEAEAHFNQIMQGDTPEPPGPDNPQIVECLATFLRMKETRFQDLEDEYKPIFEQYLFKAYVNYRKFMQSVAQQQLMMKTAANAVNRLESMGMKPTMADQMPQSAPRPAPGGNNAAIVGKTQIPAIPGGE